MTAPERRPPREAFRWYGDFWRAVSDVSLKGAWILAGTRDQRRFVDALELMIGGEPDSAEMAIRTLLAARDTLVREAARITYGALLSERSDWKRLAELASSPSPAVADDAGVETWARAFRDLRPVVSFTDTVSVVPLFRAPTGAPVVTVVVNGVPRRFWLDTGSSITILSSAAAAACGVAPIGRDTLELLTPVGRLPARPAAARTIVIGGAAARDMPAMIVDAATLRLHTGDPARDAVIDGVIGFDIIRALDLTIDDVRGHVIVRKPVRSPLGERRARTLFWFGLPIVSLTAANGAPVHLALDTGAEESYGTPTLVVKTGAAWRRAERRRVHGFGGSAAPVRRIERGVVVPSVRLFLDRTPLILERVFLYDAQYPTIFTLDGTLGADAGRGGVMRIDMTNGRVEVRAR